MWAWRVLELKIACLPPRICRRIENPRIVLLDCPLEYKKGESMVRGGREGEGGRRGINEYVMF